MNQDYYDAYNKIINIQSSPSIITILPLKNPSALGFISGI